MPQSISKYKLYIYLFFFIFLSSIFNFQILDNYHDQFRLKNININEAYDIDISGNSVLRIHEINADEKIFFEPPVCMHEDCLSE